jgi:serine phosphatase RsbU (regulator of sigma subunit)
VDGVRTGARGETLAALAELARTLAAAPPLAQGLESVADTAVVAAGADVALVRVLDGDTLVARAVVAPSPALVAELLGSRVPAAELLASVQEPPYLRRTAARVGATTFLALPLVLAGELSGSLELLRTGLEFSDAERLAADAVSEHAVLALRLADSNGAAGAAGDALDLAGDALAAATEGARPAERIASLAARAAGAEAAWLWRADEDGLVLVAGHGNEPPPSLEAAKAIVSHQGAEDVDRTTERPIATVQLGEPPLGALQLRFRPGRAPTDETVAALARFAVRAAHALRAGERVQAAGSELERSRALLEVVGQAISELSLSHTLDIAAERVGELLGTDRVAVYLVEDRRLVAGTPNALVGVHQKVAERLLELALGPERGRGLLTLPDAAAEPRLADGLEPELARAGIGAAVALPLVVGGEVTGLLAAYPSFGRVPTEAESALLVALAAQLAVAVQNARLHERATTLGGELEQALAAERDAARRLGALYEISRSFAQSLSLEATLEAVAKTVAESLGVDAAGIRLPDARGAQLELRTLHVTDVRLEPVARAVLSRPQPLTSAKLRKVLRSGRPLVLTPALAPELGGAYAFLAPFLAKGSTAAVIPIATPTDTLGTMTLVSFQADRPIDEETIADALSIAGQAALAIDNARLYQQQKEFADTMQRSLLPRSAPALPGLELGAVYESSATLEVGGDVYDFVTLPDCRLAVVLGDVTGHGVDATADMAMAKYVFRSLAREHADPGGFLAAANDVVAGEIAPGKFITMTAVIADAAHDRLACACAGHPAPRLVHPDGTVEPLPARGLALGIDAGQEYESHEVPFPPGAVVVVYTDGVVEARRGSELFGLERLDRVLVAKRDRPAEAIAQAVLEACRAYAGGELADDCAVVVIARR